MTAETIEMLAAFADAIESRFERRLAVRATLTLAEAAKSLNISEDGMKRLLDAGEIPHTRIGKLYRVFPEDVNNYLEKNTKTGR